MNVIHAYVARVGVNFNFRYGSGTKRVPKTSSLDALYMSSSFHSYAELMSQFFSRVK